MYGRNGGVAAIGIGVLYWRNSASRLPAGNYSATDDVVSWLHSHFYYIQWWWWFFVVSICVWYSVVSLMPTWKSFSFLLMGWCLRTAFRLSALLNAFRGWLKCGCVSDSVTAVSNANLFIELFYSTLLFWCVYSFLYYWAVTNCVFY